MFQQERSAIPCHNKRTDKAFRESSPIANPAEFSLTRRGRPRIFSRSRRDEANLHETARVARDRKKIINNRGSREYDKRATTTEKKNTRRINTRAREISHAQRGYTADIRAALSSPLSFFLRVFPPSWLICIKHHAPYALRTNLSSRDMFYTAFMLYTLPTSGTRVLSARLASPRLGRGTCTLMK